MASVKCILCSRSLENSKSVQHGMGPVCWSKYNKLGSKISDQVTVIPETYAKRLWVNLKTKCICGNDLTELLGYESEFGIRLGGKKYHIFAECSKCKTQISWDKLWRSE